MTYRGFWIVCCNCLFPVRLPALLKASLRLGGSNRFLLACPACAHVEQYRSAELSAIAFRIPDPFRQEKASFYEVEVPCRVRHCKGTARIYAVAAASRSVMSLLELWKHWVIHPPCRDHSFKPSRRSTWGVYSLCHGTNEASSRFGRRLWRT
jgi:hypothetical protein